MADPRSLITRKDEQPRSELHHLLRFLRSLLLSPKTPQTKINTTRVSHSLSLSTNVKSVEPVVVVVLGGFHGDDVVFRNRTLQLQASPALSVFHNPLPLPFITVESPSSCSAKSCEAQFRLWRPQRRASARPRLWLASPARHHRRGSSRAGTARRGECQSGTFDLNLRL